MLLPMDYSTQCRLQQNWFLYVSYSDVKKLGRDVFSGGVSSCLRSVVQPDVATVVHEDVATMWIDTSNDHKKMDWYDTIWCDKVNAAWDECRCRCVDSGIDVHGMLNCMYCNNATGPFFKDRCRGWAECTYQWHAGTNMAHIHALLL